MNAFLILKMRIEISNKQNNNPVNRKSIKKLAQYLMDRINRFERGKGCSCLSILLTDDTGIQPLNRIYLDKTGITDVISLRYSSIPGETGLFSADLIVNIEQAINNSTSRWSASKELALYIAHGCDHLMGETDSSETGRRRMRRRELGWLKEAAKLNMISDLI